MNTPSFTTFEMRRLDGVLFFHLTIICKMFALNFKDLCGKLKREQSFTTFTYCGFEELDFVCWRLVATSVCNYSFAHILVNVFSFGLFFFLNVLSIEGIMK